MAILLLRHYSFEDTNIRICEDIHGYKEEIATKNKLT